MDITARINELLADGQVFCLATVITSDTPDIVAGQKTIIHGDGSLEWETGQAQLNLSLREKALAVLKAKKRATLKIAEGLRVFFDILSSESSLVVCGAGHIAVPLARFARDVGFNVTVLDDRSDFAHPSRFPACSVIAENFTTALRDMPLNSSSYVVIITRGHEHDVDCLMEILPKEAAYVGLIGSRRRVRFVLEWLEKNGFSRQRLNDVFTPIGIPIGAESPEEIALSVAAELVCVRRKGAAQARALRAAVGLDI
jgi:xanthine dehydrogenase accessory factor